MEYKKLEQAVRDAGYTPEAYCGRGTKSCLSVTTRNPVETALNIQFEFGDRLPTTEQTTDRMLGSANILYWPSVPYTEG